jgi:hypothetical protein
MAIWLMDGLNVLSGTGMVGPASDGAFNILLDFNGDEERHIVWQNLDGSAAIWLMNGLSVLGGTGLVGPATGWSVVHIGDFNGDGKRDIVWQPPMQHAMWLMDAWE